MFSLGWSYIWISKQGAIPSQFRSPKQQPIVVSKYESGDEKLDGNELAVKSVDAPTALSLTFQHSCRPEPILAAELLAKWVPIVIPITDRIGP